MGNNADRNLDDAIKGELYKVIERLGGKSDILAVVGSYGDTLSDEEVLQQLREWNKAPLNGYEWPKYKEMIAQAEMAIAEKREELYKLVYDRHSRSIVVVPAELVKQKNMMGDLDSAINSIRDNPDTELMDEERENISKCLKELEERRRTNDRTT